MSSQDQCLNGGYTVNRHRELSSDPTTCYSDADANPVGCNNLICSNCGSHVRSLDGKRYVGGDEALERMEPLFAAAEHGRKLPYVQAAPADSPVRLYFCRCHVHHELDASPTKRGDESPLSVWPACPWRCGGH